MNNMIQTADSQVLFVGSFTHSLDAKRRIIFPSTWRNQMGDAHRMFAFPHPEDKCLYLYSEGEMMRRLNQLRSGGPLDKADQQTLRSFTAGAGPSFGACGGEGTGGAGGYAHAHRAVERGEF